MSTTLEAQPTKIDLAAIQTKVIHLFVFGHGTVGSKLIDQIVSTNKDLLNRRNLDLKIVGVGNSQTMFFEKEGVSQHWREEKELKGIRYTIDNVIQFVKEQQLNQLIAIDNTASGTFIAQYATLIEHGFHLVSSNKLANTGSYAGYTSLRNSLQRHKKEYLYETNVGAGLPLIDTIKLLHLSGENITRIKGVFSGSLSYIFNVFSESEQSFSSVLQSAIDQGFTEPDPREDLSGADVARKLLILARELDLNKELSDVSLQNLVPRKFQKESKENFIANCTALNAHFNAFRSELPPEHVLRYVGELHGDLSKVDGGILDVSLISLPKNTPLGQLNGSDSIFEIFTETYGNHPIVIQGAGAGAAVTARGVFGDILRLSEKLS